MMMIIFSVSSLYWTVITGQRKVHSDAWQQETADFTQKCANRYMAIEVGVRVGFFFNSGDFQMVVCLATLHPPEYKHINSVVGEGLSLHLFVPLLVNSTCLDFLSYSHLGGSGKSPNRLWCHDLNKTK